VVCLLSTRDPSPERPAESAIIGYEMSKAVSSKAKLSRRGPAKDTRKTLSTRRRRSKAEDRLDGMAATKALKESAERIPYHKARRDLGF